jgi:hypothetical protein
VATRWDSASGPPCTRNRRLCQRDKPLSCPCTLEWQTTLRSGHIRVTNHSHFRAHYSDKLLSGPVTSEWQTTLTSVHIIVTNHSQVRSHQSDKPLSLPCTL